MSGSNPILGGKEGNRKDESDIGLPRPLKGLPNKPETITRTTHQQPRSTSISTSSSNILPTFPSQPRQLPQQPHFHSPSPTPKKTNHLNQNTSSNSPLPILPPAPPNNNIRASLTRRRSSYPPATTPSASFQTFPWIVGGTPTFETTGPNDSFPGFGLDAASGGSMAAWTTPWESLLDFATPSKHDSLDPTQGQGMKRSRSKQHDQPALASSSKLTLGVIPPPAVNPGSIAQFGQDLAWKTILGSVVDVEGVGEVGVVRVLQEVWKKGGGDAVTTQCTWPSVLIALSLPPFSEDPNIPPARIPTPSAHNSLALQQLYNLTLRHWEPSIFSGLLGQYASQLPNAPAPPAIPPVPSHMAAFGASTPTKEIDLSMSQWTNLTPGLGTDLSLLLGESFTPRGSFAQSSLSQFEFHFDNNQSPASAEEEQELAQARGIDEILASMEEGAERAERHRSESIFEIKGKNKAEPVHLPTPETDGSDTPALPLPVRLPNTVTQQHISTTPVSSHNPITDFSPESMASPYVTASSATSAVSRILPAATSRAPPPTQLMMPTQAFIPPPPMCMFFNPSFKDLQQGKVGVWKGDLQIRGRGGGVFSVLIVGEEGSGDLWQSQSWPSSILYPPEMPADLNASCTATMIPVSHLAREGFTPITMGMVLCNDANIENYVNMVQGLHAEGVAFHLTNPGKLPIVILPAKFDSADPLQRLGVAFMSKPGHPLPPSVAHLSRPIIPVKKARQGDEGKDLPKKKKRRQSAPAKTGGVKKGDLVAKMASGSGIREVEEEVIVAAD